MMSVYRIEWPAWADWYEVNGTPTRSQSSGVYGGGYVGVGDNDGRYIGWYVATAAGTFTLTATYFAASSAGKFQMSIDGVNVGSLTDAYNAGSVYNNVYTATGIVLTEGAHLIRMTANGKNASSTQYRLFPQWFSLERTGA